jgi:hypothetical protein
MGWDCGGAAANARMRTATIVSSRRRGRCCARTPRRFPFASVKTVSNSVGSPPSTARRKQRRDLLSLFRRQRLGEMAAEQLGVRPPGGLLRCFVHVHVAALHVVQARGHHEAVDQPQVDVLQTVGHFTDMLNQSFTMRQQRHGRFNGLGDRSPYSATGCCPARSIP